MASKNTPAPKATPTSKAGAARSPQDSADNGAFTVAEGHSVRAGGRVYKAGSKFDAIALANKRDPTGERNVQRLIESGELLEDKEARAAAKAAAENSAAGGGNIDTGGALGAGPSGAQVQAAEAGDEGSQAVVDASLTGSKADFTAAADPDGEAARAAAAKGKG